MERDLNTARLAAETEMLEAEAPNKRAAWRGIVADSGSKMEQFTQMFENGGFAADVARRKAEALKRAEEVGLVKEQTGKTRAEKKLAELDMPRAEAEAKWMENLGQANPIIRTIIELLRATHSAGSLIRR